MRVLMAEDHADSGELLKRLLESKGHEVVWVLSGTDAIRLCDKDQRFDLLVFDIGLPDCDGWELLPQVKARCKAAKSIAFSAFAMARDIDKSQKAGFDFHLTKPIVIRDLIAAVESLAPTPAHEKGPVG